MATLAVQRVEQIFVFEVRCHGLCLLLLLWVQKLDHRSQGGMENCGCRIGSGMKMARRVLVVELRLQQLRWDYIMRRSGGGSSTLEAPGSPRLPLHGFPWDSLAETNLFMNLFSSTTGAKMYLSWLVIGRGVVVLWDNCPTG